MSLLQEVQVKAQKAGPLAGSDCCLSRPKLPSGEDGCESHAGGCTQEPVLGGGFELLAAALRLAACSSMGFDGEHARLLWSARSVRAQSDARRVPFHAE